MSSLFFKANFTLHPLFREREGIHANKHTLEFRWAFFCRCKIRSFQNMYANEKSFYTFRSVFDLFRFLEKMSLCSSHTVCMKYTHSADFLHLFFQFEPHLSSV